MSLSMMDIQKLLNLLLKLWNGWEVRLLVLLSLLLQAILIILGNRRKHTSRILLGFVVWLAYSSADSMAIFTLGIVAHSQGRSAINCTDPSTSSKLNVPSFWAPILLVHLGGPDTITAYSVEDNELWLRHLLQLATQAGWTCYALFSSWVKDPLIIMAIPVFVAGVIKYGERIWVLRLASSETFRDSENEEMKKLQEFDSNFTSHELIELNIGTLEEHLKIGTLEKHLNFSNIIPEAKYLHEAHFLFRLFKILFADLVLNDSIHMASYHILCSKEKASEAFKLIEVELGFAYDIFYTKMTGIRWSRVLLRSISFLSTACALVTFILMTKKNQAYSKTEIIVSYLLLVGGMVLEIYSIIVVLFSDWTMLWLSKQKNSLANAVYQAIHCCTVLAFSKHERRWNGFMAQHNIVDASQSNKILSSLKKLLKLGSIQSWVKVDDNLKQLIHKHLLDKHSRYSHQMPRCDPGMNDLKEILAERGDHVLQSEGHLGEFRWAVVDMDFHGSLLTWHIATDICYHDDRRKLGGNTYKVDPNCEMSIFMSNYMLYLLSDCPVMLPKGFGEARYTETSSDVSKYSWCWRSEKPHRINWDSDVFLEEIERNRSKISVLLDGCKLARLLQSHDEKLEYQWSHESKWKMVSKVWVEILTFAAAHCGWKEHAKTLTRGGELLTHVCLLMAHLGLSEQCLTQ